MKLLCVGDVVSCEGVEFLAAWLPRLRRTVGADAVIVNGENAAVGNGIDLAAYEGILAAGADVVTGGNHSFQKKSAVSLHDEQKRLLRPANLIGCDAGVGEITLEFCRFRLRVINLAGSLYLKECENPFACMDRLLAEPDDAITVVDFHAEATSEKRAMGFFLDGRVSLLFGTHTHVQTADAQILPRGTGYITDLGMTGATQAVLGKEIECCVHNFRYPENRVKIRDGQGACALSGIVAEINEQTKKCVRIGRVTVDNARGVVYNE